MLFGLLFFVPFLGLAIGAGMGALFGKLGKTGIDSRCSRRWATPCRRASRLVPAHRADDRGQVPGRRCGHQATLVRSNLDEQEAQLKEAFGAEKHAKD